MVRFTIYTLFLSILLHSCSDKSSENLPQASGKLGSLLLVAEESVTQFMAESVDSLFLTDAGNFGPAFFELNKITPAGFSDQHQLHRTILVLVDAGHTDAFKSLLKGFNEADMEKWMKSAKPEIQSKRNLFAKFQHVVYVFGKDAADLKTKLSTAAPQLKSMLISFELLDEHDKIQTISSSNDTFTNAIAGELGLGIKVPASFSLKYHKNKTWWFEQNSGNAESGSVSLLMHAYPYKDTSDFGYFSIRAVRDTISKYMFRGELPGTYMGTSESSFYPEPVVTKVKFGKAYGTKVKGWWTIRGLSQAGPYIRYVLKVPGEDRLFVYEGFINKAKISAKDSDLRLIESLALSIKK